MALQWSAMSGHVRGGLVLSMVQAMVVIALEIVVAVYFITNVDVGSNDQAQGSGKSITVYLFIFIFTQIYQFIILFDAVWNQNTIQIFGHLLFTTCMVSFSVFQIFQIREALSKLGDFNNDPEYYQAIFATILPYLISSSVILAVGVVIFVYLAFKLYLEFGWKIYKKIGADPRKRDMYRSYQILIMLLKFALYFFLAYAIQYTVLVLKTSDPEFALTIVAIVASFFIVFIVVYALKRENKIIMGIWLFFLLLVLTYFSFKIGRIYDPNEKWKYYGSGKFLTLFASLGLGVTLVTLVYSVISLLNFGKGLNDHLEDVPASGEETHHSTDTGSSRRRMILA